MKKRLDFIVAEKENVSRSRAQFFIKQGYIFVDDIMQNRPSFQVEDNVNITIKNHDNYVSRGAYKLLKAIKEFNIDVEKKTVIDMGASTGGFTQVLLEKGAKKVFSVDVGKGELDSTLACDIRVVNMEGRDIRSLSKEEIKNCQMVVGDLSFISLTHILPHIKTLLGNIEMVVLFKPQFECGKDIARKYKGVIKDKKIHKKLLNDFIEELNVLGFMLSNITYSPIKGGSGNIEYLLHLNGNSPKDYKIENVVDSAFEVL